MSISIIMSAFNEEKFIAQSINSLLNQSYKKFELLIIDDCSNDRTMDIIKSYAVRDNRIKVYQNKFKKNLSENLNYLIKLTKYEYIARADADDFYHIDRLKEQKYFLDYNLHIDILGTDAYTINNKSIEISEILKSKHNNNIKKVIFYENPIIHSSVMLRKSSLIQKKNFIYNPKLKRTQDYDLWLKLFNGKNIYTLNHKLTYYRNANQLKLKYLLKDIYYGNLCRLNNNQGYYLLIKSLVVFNISKLNKILLTLLCRILYIK